MDMKRWYVMHSNPRKESMLYEQLTIHQIETYLPQIRVRRVNPRARKVVPYFPGYLFIYTELEHVGQSLLNHIPGAIGLVNFGDEPAVVPDYIIQEIRHKVDLMNSHDFSEMGQLKPGDRVKIQDGPFVGYEAIFDTYISGTQRARVLLKMLQDYQVKLDINANDIDRSE
jgi:transcription elongation factor/antiterminator RfaH